MMTVEKREQLLEQAKGLTDGMRDHQSDITTLGAERRDAFKLLRKHGISVREIASHIGVSPQAVYNELEKE